MNRRMRVETILLQTSEMDDRKPALAFKNLQLSIKDVISRLKISEAISSSVVALYSILTRFKAPTHTVLS